MEFNVQKCSRSWKRIPSFIRFEFIKKLFLFYFFLKDYFIFKKEAKKYGIPVRWIERNPQLFDKTQNTNFDPHYLYHPAWAARILKEINPDFHIDISSTLYFCTLVSAFIPVKFFDFRPAKINLSNLISDKADLTNLVFQDNSVKSISCMHTVEHIGLGRYGDPIDVNGDKKAVDELRRVITFGGNLLFVVPIGKSRIIFNAHRIYSYRQILDFFPDFILRDFSLIPDNASEVGLINHADEKTADNQNYACGCFWFVKK